MPKEDPRIIELRERRAKARQGGGKERIDKQHAKGKLTARERIDILLDAGTFQELEPFVTQRADLGGGEERLYTDGVVTGFGKIDGRTVYVYSQDFTIGGGSLGEMTSHKICRVMDLAVRNGSPIVGLIDSGGARIQEGIYSLAGYGEIFKRNAQYSGIIPQISVIMGPCAGGASYSPALTDLIIMVEKQSYMFLTGPEVIKAVTGEVVDFESLGGAAVHLATSGTAHLTAKKDEDALKLVRMVLGYFPTNNMENAPVVDTKDDPGAHGPGAQPARPPGSQHGLQHARRHPAHRGQELLPGAAADLCPERDRGICAHGGAGGGHHQPGTELDGGCAGYQLHG